MSAQLALQQYEARYRSAADQFRFWDIHINGQLAVLSLLVATSFIAFNPFCKTRNHPSTARAVPTRDRKSGGGDNDRECQL